MSRLSSREENALYRLEKHGELMLEENGRFYNTPVGWVQTEAKLIEKLAALGHCRIDRVGSSTFAVFVKGR